MPRPRKYPPSWIDDEGFKPAAYKFLRELVVVYQTKEELVKHLTTNGWLVYHGPNSSRIYNEIDAWLEKQSMEERQHDYRWLLCKDAHVREVSRVNREMSAKFYLGKHQIYPRLLQYPNPPVYDGEKFSLFIKELKELLMKHGVTIESDFDGCISVESVDWNIYKGTDIDDWFNMIIKQEEMKTLRPRVHTIDTRRAAAPVVSRPHDSRAAR